MWRWLRPRLQHVTPANAPRLDLLHTAALPRGHQDLSTAVMATPPDDVSWPDYLRSLEYDREQLLTERQALEAELARTLAFTRFKP